MAIVDFDSKVQKIYESPAKGWNMQLKQLDDHKIVSLIKTVVAAPEKCTDKDWNFVSLALSELAIRKWSKKHPSDLEAIRTSLAERSDKCFAASSYSIENAGLSDKDQVYHPYPHTGVTKELVRKWEKSKTSKSLEEYIATYTHPAIQQSLRINQVKYLSSKDYPKYRVTFKNAIVKIGKKTAKDGRYIFALGGKKPKLLAGVKRKARFQHTSFFAGAPVTCAGVFDIKDGKMVKVMLRSGHYKPLPKHGELLREFLKSDKNFGLKEAENLIIQPYSN